jgi:hypothetical protein
VIAKQSKNLTLALLGWRDEEDLVGASAGAIIEVAGVGSELSSKATWLLGAPVPFQMEH